jgi:threonine dehydrogenase-like Zn-dependent dehydrogenase
MLALNYRGPYRVRVEEKQDPRIEHPDDVVLRVVRTTICGSDLHLYHGYIPDSRVGMTLGHEFTGVVEELGATVESLKMGDRVVVPFNVACGTCWYCQRGMTSLCDNSNPCSSFMGGAFGYSHTAGGYDGGQAERVRVPFADVGPMKIPDDMTDEEVLFLSDILPTGYEAAEMGHIRPEDTVAVFGCGPVGLVTQRSAQLLGAKRVIGLDYVAERLAFARRFAQSEALDLREIGDPIAHLRSITDGRGPDVCIDAVGLEANGSVLHDVLGKYLKLQAGAPTTINWSIDAVRKGGTVVLIAVYGPPWNLVNIGTAMNKGLNLQMGQCNVKRHLPHLLEHIRKGRLDAKALITHRFPLAEAEAAYRLFDSRKDGVIKCVLIPKGQE